LIFPGVLGKDWRGGVMEKNRIHPPRRTGFRSQNRNPKTIIREKDKEYIHRRGAEVAEGRLFLLTCRETTAR